jgi:hypothetical protein
VKLSSAACRRKLRGKDVVRHAGRLDTIDENFAQLVGLSCWNVACGYGSFVTFEFGDPHLESGPTLALPVKVGTNRVKVPSRSIHVRGEWYLWIYCCFWRLFWDSDEVVFCETDPKEIQVALSTLSGARFKSIEVSPENGATTFTFGLDWVLETSPYESPVSRERLGAETAEEWEAGGPVDQWLLYEPSGMVLSVDNHGTLCHIDSTAAR